MLARRLEEYAPGDPHYNQVEFQIPSEAMSFSIDSCSAERIRFSKTATCTKSSSFRALLVLISSLGSEIIQEVSLTFVMNDEWWWQKPPVATSTRLTKERASDQHLWERYTTPTVAAHACDRLTKIILVLNNHNGPTPRSVIKIRQEASEPTGKDYHPPP